ncbi:MAG: sugar phosphate isomerase/epimerase [Propionibacteriaceae bacterium]|jgi:sugar phosphate isomerase/epimerase|nr:sugar phosphate isomerase/epimerase [Propionibacteriaceae bacterium]
MKIGFVSALLDETDLEDCLAAAASLGYSYIEAASWPAGGSERRYAGTSHVNADDYSQVAEICARTQVGISSLGFYPNPLGPDGKQAIAHLHKLIDASAALGIGMVTTFIGRDQHKSVEENLVLAGKVWPEIIAHAEEAGVRIGIENCPMLFDSGQWPGGQNLFTTPAIWREVFAMLDSDNLGINYDPSHFVWQQIDPIKPLYEFADKLFHVHIKDIHVDPYKLDDVGVMAYPLQYMSPKLPGHGDLDWGAFISALDDVGYAGPICVEVEDRAYETSLERKLESLALSLRYLSQFMA